MMKKLKRILLGMVGLGVVTGVGGWLWVWSWLNAELSKDALVRHIEKGCNCRAQIDDFTWSLATSPAKLELTKLQLAPRDSEADAGKPLAQRTALDPGAVQVIAEKALLEIDWSQLVLHRRLHIGRLALVGLFVREEVSKEGDSSLAMLLAKPVLPDAVVAANEPSIPLPKTPTTTPEIPATEVPDPPAETADAVNAGIAFVIDEAVLERAAFHINNRAAKTRTDISDLNLKLSHIDVDPTDLAQHNTCDVTASGKVVIEGRAKIGEVIKPVRLADLTLTSTGKIIPFDIARGELAPLTTLTIAVQKGSTLYGYDTIGNQLAKQKKTREMMQQLGIDILDVTAGGALQEDMTLQVKAKDGRFDVLADMHCVFPDYRLRLNSGSWFDGTADALSMGSVITLSPALGKRVIQGAQAKVGFLADTAAKVMNDGQGNVAIELNATGMVSKPEIKLGGKLGEIMENPMQALGSGLLQGLLK